MTLICACELNGSILDPGLVRHRSVQPFFFFFFFVLFFFFCFVLFCFFVVVLLFCFSKCFACLVGRAYYILSSLRKT